MEQEYLLTYDIFLESGEQIQTFCWFENEEDMEDFIENTNNITVIDKLRIIQCDKL